MNFKTLKVLSLAAVFSLAAAAPAVGQQAASMGELLRLIEQGKARDSTESRQREQRFAAAKTEQQSLLAQVKQQRANEEAKSERLETLFEENETRIAEMTETLNKRQGSLKELFGVLQQVAGDTHGLFEASLTSIQYPDRGQFLTSLMSKLATGTDIADIEEIEQLWFELQREMTESGKIVRFPATVITADGEQVQDDVLRVGLFNVARDGKYLNYSPSTKMLAELQRQPPQARFIKGTSELMNAQTGFTPFGVDPSRGQILSLLVQTPDQKERLEQGGTVGYVIVALGILALLIALERMIFLGIAGRKVSSQLKSDTPDKGNPLGRVLLKAEEHAQADTETLELKLSEAIMGETPPLGRGLLWLKIIGVIAPLLGLLGTVVGMINTFQVITLFGAGDPQMMAGGISQALQTTKLGLIVAIPTVFLHTLVSGRSKRIVHVLQEQSAGIIAERAEKLH